MGREIQGEGSLPTSWGEKSKSRGGGSAHLAHRLRERQRRGARAAWQGLGSHGKERGSRGERPLPKQTERARSTELACGGFSSPCALP
eukprot:3703074-Pleurochrysis_carterae.AAC.1